MSDDPFGDTSYIVPPAVVSEIIVAQDGKVMDPQPLVKPHEPMPFIVRPFNEEQPRTYKYREIRVINGKSYYFYHMHDPELFKDPDAAFGSYLDALSGLDFTPPSRRRWEIDRKKVASQSWACKCEICTSPPRTEPFVTVKDYKVVEGLRLVKCKGFMYNMSQRDDLRHLANGFASVRNIPFHIPYPKEE